jgi:hypothetical protein
MPPRFKGFNLLMDAARAYGHNVTSVVEYRGKDIVCFWVYSHDTFVPKEDGVICLYNKEGYKVYCAFDKTLTEIPNIDQTRIINATGHDIHIVDGNGKCIRTLFAATGPGGITIRMQEEILNCPDIDGIKVIKREFNRVDKLPELAKDIFYVVSGVVKISYPDRADFLCPEDQVFSGDGKVIGCRALRR